MRHTPEPWAQCQDLTGKICRYGAWHIQGSGEGVAFEISRPANAARIVACVNACAGMADPAQELAALREAAINADIALGKAIESGRMGTALYPVLDGARNNLRAALSKLEGGEGVSTGASPAEEWYDIMRYGIRRSSSTANTEWVVLEFYRDDIKHVSWQSTKAKAAQRAKELLLENT